MNAPAAAREFNCPACAGRSTRLLLECEGVPTFCNVLYRTRAEALQAQRGDMRLRFCPDCGLIFNAAFEPARLAYSPDYENAQHFSPRFSRYLEQLADSLIERHHLEGKTILELGCGDGRFLNLLCRSGRNRGYGFDASLPESAEAPSHVKLIRDYYSEKYADIRADFVTCRHVLEHLADPALLPAAALQALGTRGGTVYFEVPNGLFTLRDLGIWDILYEHCSYFTEASLTRLFETNGFEVLATRLDFDGQFLGIEARPGQRTDRRLCAWDLGELTETFAERYRSKIAVWKERLAQSSGRRIALWGAGTKGVMFLNSVAGGAAVDAVVDVNPRKRGCYVAGTGQRIVGPAELRDASPSLVLIMNAAYEGEIRSTLREVEVDADVAVV